MAWRSWLCPGDSSNKVGRFFFSCALLRARRCCALFLLLGTTNTRCLALAQCCPDVSDNSVDDASFPAPQPIASGDGPYAGAVFPLAPGSLASISVNWGGSRSGGRRCHAGIDLYTTGARRVVSAGDGQVVSVMRGWYGCSGGSIDAIMVYYSSGPLAGQTVNYGEVNPGTYNVGIGSRVTAGQSLGVASRCGMLHLELYNQRVTQNYHW